MTPEQMEIRLEYWKRLIWMSVGASAGLLADAAVISRRPELDQYVAWMIVWLIFQGVAIAPAIRLTLGRDWRILPMVFRFQAIFGSLTASWLALAALGLRTQRMLDVSPPAIMPLIILVGLALAGIYVTLRKNLVTAPESMFP